MNIFDKDYKMLKAIEKSAKSRSDLCGGTTTAAFRLTRLLELGYIISDSWEPVPGQVTKFRLTGEGRACIQDAKRKFIIDIFIFIGLHVITPVAVTLITNWICHW